MKKVARVTNPTVKYLYLFLLTYLIMAHVVLKAISVSLGHSGIHFFGA